MGVSEFHAFCLDLGLPGFRSRQILSWVYGKGARSYDEMTNLPKDLRSSLTERCPLRPPSVVLKRVSSDGTRKYLIEFADGVSVETVGLPAGDRLTVCFSTQAGCGMGCTFCATGQAGLTRSLTPGEMVWQILAVADDFGRRVTNVVAMGQGEPFLNYDNVRSALTIINGSDYLGIGARHITVSTCGILKGIETFSNEPEQFTLAVSLHSAIQDTRDALMPGVARYPLLLLRDACVRYLHATDRRITFEYSLVHGVNDSDAHLDALIGFCSGLLCHVNLIPINPTDAAFAPSHESTVQRFRRELMRHDIEASVRVARGTDIEAACGQLKQTKRDAE